VCPASSGSAQIMPFCVAPNGPEGTIPVQRDCVRGAVGVLSRGPCGRSGRQICLQVCAGQRVVRTVSVAVHAIRRLGACGHGHIADSVVTADLIRWCLRRSEGNWRWGQERSVKPSASPTQVRTLDLPLKIPGQSR
jgi:hypothetical protein